MATINCVVTNIFQNTLFAFNRRNKLCLKLKGMLFMVEFGEFYHCDINNILLNY